MAERTANETPVKSVGQMKFSVAKGDSFPETKSGAVGNDQDRADTMKSISQNPEETFIKIDAVGNDIQRHEMLKLSSDGDVTIRSTTQGRLSGHLDAQTTQRIRDAISAIQASGGVSAREEDATHDLREVMTDALKAHGQFTADDVKSINDATQKIINAANPAKSGGPLLS